MIQHFIYSGLLQLLNVMFSNNKWIRVTLITFNKCVNLTDQFMLKAGCRYICTKQSVVGMQQADKLDDIS